MSRERRQLTRAELASITSSRPVVRRIKKEKASKTFAGSLINKRDVTNNDEKGGR